MPENTNNNLLNPLLFILYLIFLVSLVFAFRAVSSISIGLILITGLVKNKIEQKRVLNPQLKNLFFICCCLFFLLQIIALLYTTNLNREWKDIQMKSALVILPMALYCSNYINQASRKKILQWYCLVVFIACLFAAYTAFRNYANTNNSSVFFYHSLVSIYSGHAIQFSILVFVAILYLFESLRTKELLFNITFHFFLIIFFSIFLFLLSSKLVITFFILYFFYYVLRELKEKTKNKALIASFGCFLIFCIILFTTPNSINTRFKEIAKTDFSFLEAEKYTPGNYFNGLQFRLLQWKFVPQILNEKKAWLAGVSPGNAQSRLDQKYISENMYIGTPERGDKGFIGYNTHNQFLEALLQTGIIGLLSFVIICAALIRMIWLKRKAELSFITILVLAYSFSESVFETQYSLFIFIFFPLFFYLENNKIT
ncbi:MAG TPA: O-antigen ligase family protein [Chitinophagaceae bacterium]|jgi:O-antigen ligase|nr:O-antigen ligase family protein [Chitinophagaceae bacterium]